MALLSLQNLQFTISGPPLLDGGNLQIEPGERVSLVGRNGAGKSTLLKLIGGEISPQGGTIAFQKGAQPAFLPQEAPVLQGRVEDLVTQAAPHAPDHEIQTILMQLQIDGDARFELLSGGLKRRALLAQALAQEPDLLLLDEPTNHLDIASIAWLEDWLPRHIKTLLFVTHDRAFLRSLATRIVELDRGKLVSYACSYDQFLERREANLEAEAKQQADFDKKLAQEEVWVRRGVKARQTRNEGRVRALKKLREERQARRTVTGVANIATQNVERSGHLVMEARDASFGYDGQTLIQPFSTTILRGDKVGFLGPNGSGKTTLLRGLLGQVQPMVGSVKLGTRLQIAYFDQMRAAVEPNKTVRENVAGDNDTVTVNGVARHIISYLRDFGFPPERARTPAGVLSGGERNRLLLARLFTQPANLLVMDEPTNDLDIETLDLLEELLLNFQGTLLMVSHDRDFLDNVVTSTLALEGDGLVRENAGGYADYRRVREAELRALQPTRAPQPSAKSQTSDSKPPTIRARKMSFKERRELDELPARLEKLEAEQATLYIAMANPDFYKQNGDAAHTKARLEAVQRELEAAFARWEELEKLA